MADAMPSQPDLVELYRTVNTADAQTVCDWLAEEGIATRILGAGRDVQVLPVGESTVSVYVNREDIERSRQAIETRELPRRVSATKPIQFGLKDIAMIQFIAAIIFGLFAIFQPEFRVAYLALCGFFGGWLFVASWMAIRRRRAEH